MQEQEQVTTTPEPTPSQPLPPPDPRDSAWAEATDESGNFKTLGHKLKFEDRLPTRGPNPYDYRPDQEEDYARDYQAHQASEVLETAIRKASVPLPDGLPKDPYHQARVEADQWREEYLEKARKAEAAGRLREAAEHRARAEYKHQELAKLPRTMRDEVRDNLRYSAAEQAIVLLGEPEIVNSPNWSDPIKRREVELTIDAWNRDNRRGMILLPQEKSPRGEVAETNSKSLGMIELPDEVYRDFQDYVYDGSENDPVEIQKRSWVFLHKTGYADRWKPIVSKRQEKKPAPEETMDEKIERMSLKEFEALRRKAGARPF